MSHPRRGNPYITFRISRISKFLREVFAEFPCPPPSGVFGTGCPPMLDGTLHLPSLNRCSQNAYYKAAAQTRTIRLMPAGKRYRIVLKQVLRNMKLSDSEKRNIGVPSTEVLQNKMPPQRVALIRFIALQFLLLSLRDIPNAPS